jgi:hypothetical protein
MEAEVHDNYTDQMDSLVDSVRPLLRSPNARDRVRAIHVLARGVEVFEDQVLRSAQACGMSWTEIGAVYGVSRQAVHRKFSEATVVPSDFFNELLEDLDREPETVPALAKIAKRVHS